MRKIIGVISLALIVAASYVAVIAYLDAGQQEAMRVSRPDLNGVTLNGIALNGMALNGFQPTVLAATSLQEHSMSLTTLASSHDGREVLRVLATCALPEGDALVLEGDSTTYTFRGSLGLAPEWKEHTLSSAGQRWVTACLMAHGNAFGEHVSISLRGAHPALSPTREEATVYQVEEGVFYGNLFSPDTVLVSCIGRDGLDVQASSNLAHRVCATGVMEGETVCGFTAVGQCEAVCEGARQDREQGYTQCRVDPESPDTVSEVITVFLRRGTATTAPTE